MPRSTVRTSPFMLPAVIKTVKRTNNEVFAHCLPFSVKSMFKSSVSQSNNKLAIKTTIMIEGFFIDWKNVRSRDQILTKKENKKNIIINPVAKAAIELLTNKRKKLLIVTIVKIYVFIK